MNILIASDKFKGSLSAIQVCNAISKGLKRKHHIVTTSIQPMADGGEGSLSILKQSLSLETKIIETVDPLYRKIDAPYYFSGHKAFIELADASGLILLKEEDRNPIHTSSYGTGIMIKNAIKSGFTELQLFLGGSATNDAGIGIASALGYIFLDRSGKVLDPIGHSLVLIDRIIEPRDNKYNNIVFKIVCDVENPLYGPNGASYVYAPQKGASSHEVKILDQGLKHYNLLIQEQFKIDLQTTKGTGAAGGIPASILPFFNAEIISGFDLIADLTELEIKIKQADHVISGEGKLDNQSLQGKVISGIAKLCKKYNKPLTLIVGKNELSKHSIEVLHLDKVESITTYAKDLEDAMENGEHYLENIAYNLNLIS